MKTVLVIDVGNTSTTAGLYRDGRVRRVLRFPAAGKTSAALARDLRPLLAGRKRAVPAALCSVVPATNRRWKKALASLGIETVCVVSNRVELGISVSYPKPETIGADRLANAVAAVERYGAPVIVADFGTALTFDIVEREKGYVGGVIVPGLPLMFDYLAEKTALLPHIGPARTRKTVGKTTEEAMRIGAEVGYRGMVREILSELRSRPALQRAVLCATGGYAPWVIRGLRPSLKYDENLTLCGIGRIFELNHSG